MSAFVRAMILRGGTLYFAALVGTWIATSLGFPTLPSVVFIMLTLLTWWGIGDLEGKSAWQR